jgi:hypothetical protein
MYGNMFLKNYANLLEFQSGTKFTKRIRIQASQSSSDPETQKLESKVTLHNGVDINKNGLLTTVQYRTCRYEL